MFDPSSLNNQYLEMLWGLWMIDLCSDEKVVEPHIQSIRNADQASRLAAIKYYDDAELHLWRNNGAILCPEFTRWLHDFNRRLWDACKDK